MQLICNIVPKVSVHPRLVPVMKAHRMMMSSIVRNENEPERCEHKYDIPCHERILNINVIIRTITTVQDYQSMYRISILYPIRWSNHEKYSKFD